MTGYPRPTLPALLVVAGLAQGKSFGYAGIGLGSEPEAVAARHPGSTLQGDYLRLAPDDTLDHISAIGISGTAATRRVRIGFELTQATGSPTYPRCSAVEARLGRDFGSPQEIRRFTEEASPRADRVWRSPTEEMTLICFRDGGVLRAEAVLITPR